MESQNAATTEQPMELTEEERKRMVVGQMNYLWLMTLSLTAFIAGQNSTWTCNFATREVEFFPGFDADSVCAEANLSNIGESVCESFLDSQ